MLLPPVAVAALLRGLGLEGQVLADDELAPQLLQQIDVRLQVNQVRRQGVPCDPFADAVPAPLAAPPSTCI